MANLISGIKGFFRTIVEALGIDISLLLSFIVIGVLLSIVYTGANDSQTSQFCLDFIVLAFVTLGAAAVAKLTDYKIFRGAEDSLIEEISPKNNPVFGLIFLVVGYVLGFAISAGGALFAILTAKAQSSTTANFVFQNGFSPVIEEYFFRGFLLPFFENVAFLFVIKRFDDENIVHGISFIIADIFQSILFVFVHIVAFNGNPNQMLISFIFAMSVGVLARINLLLAIGVHAGHNGGVWVTHASSPVIVNVVSG